MYRVDKLIVIDGTYYLHSANNVNGNNFLTLSLKTYKDT